MSDPTDKKLNSCATRVILSMCNDVRLGRRKFVQFTSNGDGGLKEEFTNMNIHNDPEKVKADQRAKERLKSQRLQE